MNLSKNIIRVGKVTSNKSIGQITSELEDVTVMETESNLNTKSMDDNGKNFFLVDKKEQLYYLEPLPKISGIKQAGFIPYTKVKLLTDERSGESVIEYSIIQHNLGPFVGVIIILLLGVFFAVFAADKSVFLGVLAIFVVMAVIAGVSSFFIIKSSCDKTEKELIRLAKDSSDQK